MNSVALADENRKEEKGAWSEWHCRLGHSDLRHAAVISSCLAICLGLFKRASIFGRLLLALGSTRSGRLPTTSLELICCPSVTNSSVNITLAKSQLLASERHDIYLFELAIKGGIGLWPFYPPQVFLENGVNQLHFLS